MDALNRKARNLRQQEPGRVCHQADADDSLNVPQTRPRRQHHETAGDYERVVLRLGQNWRVIECRHCIQWILQRGDAVRSGQWRWRGVQYFKTRKALIRTSRTFCGPLCPNDADVLGAIPDRIGGANEKASIALFDARAWADISQDAGNCRPDLGGDAMTEATLTRDIGGKWHRLYGCAACPCCQTERFKTQNALTLVDGHSGRLLLLCKRSGCSFHDILAVAGIMPCDYVPPDAATIMQRKREKRAQNEKRARQVERCRQEALPICGTIAETDLRGRGITCALPSTLRFQLSCWHASAKRFPVLVALIEGANGCAVRRTYLRYDGTGKAGVSPDKAMLGAVSGGAVRLTEAQGALVGTEGIETALSLASGFLGRSATIWAALSTSGLRLPPSPGRLTIATDGDDPGRAAGRDLAERAQATGWGVSLLLAPDGRDWCDVLVRKAVAA